jgi:hypothetical protein
MRESSHYYNEIIRLHRGFTLPHVLLCQSNNIYHTSLLHYTRDKTVRHPKAPECECVPV